MAKDTRTAATATDQQEQPAIAETAAPDTTGEPVTEESRGPRGAAQNRGLVKAVCPRNAGHPGARVHTTKGRIRHCVCDTCGEQWKITGPYADPLREYVLEYCESVDEGIRVQTEINGRPCVILTVDSARKLIRRLRELVAT